MCIHHIFEQQAAATPDAIALVSAGNRWTYAQLNARANQIAHWLRVCKAAQPDSFVALSLDRSAGTIAAILGILKSGAAYAPLDPNDPQVRRAALLADLNPIAILDAETLAQIPDGPTANLAGTTTPRSLAYVMFTSGSTGTPKGVLIEHRSVVRLVRDADYADFGPSQTFLQLAPLSFDASTLEIWGPLLNGGTLAIAKPALLSLSDIAQTIQEYSVTTLWLTAGLFHAMVDEQPAALASLRQLLAGGDVLSPAHVRRFLDAAPNTRLINGYGPTENTTFTCCYNIPRDHPANAPIPIGTPINGTTLKIVDGELYAGGLGVARGYLNQPALTAARFEDGFYRTGDLVRQREDGVVEFLGRADHQIKLSGYRIEPGEIEAALAAVPGIGQAAVVLHDKRLIAHVTGTANEPKIRAALRQTLPPYMVPNQFVFANSLPLTPNGKVDRKALAALEKTGNPLETIANAWAGVLNLPNPDRDTAFFDLGGTSLQLMKVHARIESDLHRAVPIADLFQFPTIHSLARHLSGEAPAAATSSAVATNQPVAIVGMAARLPGAANIAQFWENLKNGVESITFFADAELEIPAAPNAVKARPILDNPADFDAALFGILPKEAETMDPQHRVFLECAATALDDANIDPAHSPGPIGVFAGCSPNSYFLHNLCGTREYIEDYTGAYQVGNYQTMLGTSQDFLATRVSYKLNLSGPSITLGTACSTSLVAVTQACGSLRSGECDVALAGGVSITFPQRRSYVHQEGGIVSPDGHCRAFDADAQGTIFGDGCGVVVLKRLDDALAAGDSIYAIIKGYGLNNDGASKAGFTAPSVDGQADAIRRAHRMAGVTADTITYVEAHGTATPLGDPIEIAGLTQAFGRSTTQYCALGTAKTNVGHLDAAAGVTGLIKAALSVKHGVLPPTLHFQKPNPRIDLSTTPFYVNAQLTPWNSAPRRAGVSAFGVGGTNAHLVLEQAPEPPSPVLAPAPEVYLLSAKSTPSLDAMADSLLAHLANHPGLDPAAVSYALATGRRRFEHRRMIHPRMVNQGTATTTRLTQPLPVAFAFPGQGSQYPAMGQELYRDLPVFRAAIDACGLDLTQIQDPEALSQTAIAQPALFAIEYALAQQWIAWGIQPQAMIGHSVGEFVAATLAGVFTLQDALAIVAERGRLMQALPPGAMLSLRAAEAQVRPLLPPDLAIAAVNSPQLCVVAGPHTAIEDFEAQLAGAKITSRRLRTSHAFHSPMMDPALEALQARIAAVRLSAPRIPYVSTLTGDWITNAEATDPAYWARHCRETVQFSQAIQRLNAGQPYLHLEVGPGQTLTTLARQHNLTAAASETTGLPALGNAIGRLWLSGVEPDWSAIYGERRKPHLPGYSYDRKRFWIEAPKSIATLKKSPERTEIQMTVETAVIDKPTDRLRSELIALLQDLSGMDLQTTPAGATFLELGFDSLFLTQVTQALDSKYGVKIRFAQLLDDLATLESLGSYLEARVAPRPTPTAAPAPAAASAPVPSGALEQLIQQQLQAFNDLAARQLEAIRGGGAAQPIASPAPKALAAPKLDPPKLDPPKFETFGPYKPIQKGPTGGLTPDQSRYLDQFIARYTRRTPESKRITQQHRAYLADPRVAGGFRALWKEMVYPVTIQRSLGSKLWDVDGNEYIDILNGFGVTMFGHRPEFVEKAVAHQLTEGFEIGPQTPLAGQVAQQLCELTGMERATFCNTGSEAVMAAMRLARTVTGKDKVVYFSGDYHGSFDEVLVRATSRPIAPGIPAGNTGNMIVLEYGSPAALETIRTRAGEIAAVLVEPVQSRHPNLRPIEFLRELRALTEQHNVALIFDEVVTGFRTHPGGVQAMFGIRADLATYGKVIGGGMPIGALAGSARYMDALDGGIWRYGDESSPEVGVTFFAGTFVRHPLALAACSAVLKHIQDSGPQLQDDLSEKTGRLVAQLNQLFEQGQVPARIENFRSIFYFGFPATERYASLLHYHLRLHGIHIQEGFPCFLTTAHSEADLNRIVEAFRTSIAEMQEGGFLPAPILAAPILAAHILAAQPMDCEAPLTEAQMEIRLSAQLGDEESCSYNEGFHIRLRGALDEPVLRRSLQTVIDRHEALRATLTTGGDRLHISARSELALPLVDLTGLTIDDQADRIHRIKEEDARKAFDLVAGPLVRAQLVRLAPNDHILFITAHHMICDGWSINVILAELSALYSGGGNANLAAPLRFSDYAHRQATHQVDPRVETYWVSQFSESAPPLELPLDRPRPALKSYHGSTFTATIDAPQYQRIKKAGAQLGLTLFNTLLGGFQALLARLSGQADIVVGIPAAAQSQLADQILVGHCVNFLPIRARLADGMTAKELLTQTKRKVIEAYEHQSYTYGTLVRKLAIPRNPSRLPLIEVQFNLERVGGALQFSGLEAEVQQNPKRFVNFDIFLNVVESAQGLTLYCDYNTDLFDESTIARWLKHYQTLLLSIAADAVRPVAELPILSPADLETLTKTWNATQADYPRTQTIHALIDEQAARTPHAPAVRFADRTLTYAELAHKSTQLAAWLVRDHKVQPNQLIGISFEPSPEMLIAVLAVLKTGSAYVPLDPGYPQERIQFIREDAALSLILTADNWPDFASTEGSTEPLPLPVVPSTSLAYVIYTSGSTGTPKGVEIEHRSVVNFLWSMRRAPGIEPTDKLLAVTTLSFDIAGLELFLPLVAGAQVVIASRDAARDGNELARLLNQGITLMQATPTTWKLLLEAGWTGSPQFRTALCGGEALTADLANQLAAVCPSLWNMYGPTEATIWSTLCRVQGGDGPVSIGRPIANTQIHILDSHGKPVPIGVPGELCIGGDGLARGYFHRPELTADRFQTNGDAGRIYHTGDLARYLPSGDLICLGRLDRQVKIRGHRIELGEIESALLAQPQIRDAAVIVRQDSPGEKRLTAYVVAPQLNQPALRLALAGRLPDYMIPPIFVALDALPLTPNGKIDRAALGKLPPPAAIRNDSFAAPITHEEVALARVWEQVLNTHRNGHRIGLDDDLFSLGADSIHLFQIAARASREGLAVTPKQLLQNRTVRALARALASPAPTKPVSSIKAVSRDRFRLNRNN